MIDELLDAIEEYYQSRVWLHDEMVRHHEGGGYDFDYHYSNDIDRLEKKRVTMKNLLDHYIDKRVELVIETRGMK